jgi:adenylate cyclase
MRSIGEGAAWPQVLMSGLTVGLCIVLLRILGALQSLELSAYDLGLRWRQDTEPTNTVVVAFGDADFETWGWPLPDSVLADVIQRIGAAAPLAIGLDIYRDQPVEPGSDALADTLSATPQLVGVFKFALPGEAGVAPPPALEAEQRYGFADVASDTDGGLRRWLLFLDDGQRSYTSLALMLAELVLAQENLYPTAAAGEPSVLQLGHGRIPPLDGEEGGYRGIDAGGYQFLLDYRRGAEAVALIWARDLLQGAVAPSVLAGKIVLVGTVSETVKDAFLSAAGGRGLAAALTPGVVLHALATEQLLRLGRGEASPTAVLSPLNEHLLIIAVALLAAALARWTPGTRLTASVVILGGIAAVGGWLAALDRDLWLPGPPVLLAWVLAAALSLAAATFAERRAKRALVSLFAQQVAPSVATALWQRREEIFRAGRMVGRKIEATMLFVDLVGSTTLAARTAPEIFTDWIGGVLERLTLIVSEAGGLVEKYTGDGLLAVFNAPLPAPDDPQGARAASQALACARDMLRVQCSGELPRLGDVEPRLRIGIQSGSVIAGTVGSRERQQFTVLGDAVNTAQRLEALGKEIDSEADAIALVGAETAALAGFPADLEPLHEVVLRGRDQALRVYRLSGPEAARSN